MFAKKSDTLHDLTEFFQCCYTLKSGQYRYFDHPLKTENLKFPNMNHFNRWNWLIHIFNNWFCFES